MKNLIYSICIVFVLFACSDDPNVENFTPELTTEALVTNQDFINLLNAQQLLTESFSKKMKGLSDNQQQQYLQTLDKLLTEDSQESKEKIAQMLGFDSAINFADTQNKMLTSAKRLTEQFPTIEYNDQIQQIFIEATTHLNYQKAYNINSRVAGNCGDKLSNCRDKADATLALATAGCVSSVFIPVAGPFIGVGCEAAALYNHYTDYEKCNLDYEDCAQ